MANLKILALLGFDKNVIIFLTRLNLPFDQLFPLGPLHLVTQTKKSKTEIIYYL